MTTSPRKGTESDGLSSLREGMGNMDISSRANSGDYSFSREKDKDVKDGAKGRDVSTLPAELISSSTDSYHREQRP